MLENFLKNLKDFNITLKNFPIRKFVIKYKYLYIKFIVLMIKDLI